MINLDKFIQEFETVDLHKYKSLGINLTPFRCHLYYEYLWKVKKVINFDNETKLKIAEKAKTDYVNSIKGKYRNIIIENLKYNKSLLYLQQKAILLEYLKTTTF